VKPSFIAVVIEPAMLLGIMFGGICLFLSILNFCFGIKGLITDGATLQCFVVYRNIKNGTNTN